MHRQAVVMMLSVSSFVLACSYKKAGVGQFGTSGSANAIAKTSITTADQPKSDTRRCKSARLVLPLQFSPGCNTSGAHFFASGAHISKVTSMEVYNRQGDRVFHAADIPAGVPEKGWDGTFNGIPLTRDVFIYSVSAVDDSGEKLSSRGFVYLQ